jgi:FkbM family methyltransferase
MRITEFVKAMRSVGMKAMLFRGLYASKIMNLEQLGKLAELLGNSARLDGITISMDSQFIGAAIKGEIMVDWYEYQERQLIQRYFPNNEPVIELGASIGVVACMVNRRLTLPNHHVVVEANPDLVHVLKKNRDMNQCQFHIIEAAIGYGSAYITFFSNEGSLAGSIYQGGGKPMTVPTRTLQSIAEGEGFSHFNLICDVEGSEIDIINHELTFISEHVGLMLLETHHLTPYGEEGMRTVIENLQKSGFEIIDNIHNNYCLQNGAFAAIESI